MPAEGPARKIEREGQICALSTTAMTLIQRHLFTLYRTNLGENRKDMPQAAIIFGRITEPGTSSTRGRCPCRRGATGGFGPRVGNAHCQGKRMEPAAKGRAELSTDVQVEPPEALVALNGAENDALGEATFDLRRMLQALQAVRVGDFSVRLPGDQIGLNGKIADTFNEIVAANERMAQQL